MASSDLNQLLDMGFEKERAELAVKKATGSMYFQQGHPSYSDIAQIEPNTLCSGRSFGVARKKSREVHRRHQSCGGIRLY